MQFTFRDVIEQRYGAVETDHIFFEAGKLAGREFYKQMFTEIPQPGDLLRQLEAVLREMSMGILRVEQADFNTGHLVVTISEDLDCSGIPESGDEVCTYDEGFISGILESYTGSQFQVKEIDCWSTGNRTCRFRADRITP